MVELNQLSNSKIEKILDKALNSQEITKIEGLELLKCSGNDFLALQLVANYLCSLKKENIVTFVINRNINFTNICTSSCKFCSFNVSKNHKEAYLLSLEEIKEKILEAKDKNCTEVCIQGGLNPKVDFQFYLDILKVVKSTAPEIHAHAFSPQEIFYMTQLNGLTLEDTLKELKKAGLDSIPGTAAEILNDEIRKIICPKKITTEQWIEIISTAHKLEIPTTSTIMYGHIESLEDRMIHLEIIRNIQKETSGITEFVLLPYVKENPMLSKIRQYPLKPTYGMDDLKLFCVARIFLNNNIDNIQCSWVKLGPRFAQISLNYGVNDFSGTLLEENISRSAGAHYGEYLKPEEIINIIKSAGKRPAQRDTVYNIIKYY